MMYLPVALDDEEYARDSNDMLDYLGEHDPRKARLFAIAVTAEQENVDFITMLMQMMMRDMER